MSWSCTVIVINSGAGGSKLAEQLVNVYLSVFQLIMKGQIGHAVEVRHAVDAKAEAAKKLAKAGGGRRRPSAREQRRRTKQKASKHTNGAVTAPTSQVRTLQACCVKRGLSTVSRILRANLTCWSLARASAAAASFALHSLVWPHPRAQQCLSERNDSARSQHASLRSGRGGGRAHAERAGGGRPARVPLCRAGRGGAAHRRPCRRAVPRLPHRLLRRCGAVPHAALPAHGSAPRRQRSLLQVLSLHQLATFSDQPSTRARSFTSCTS